MEFSYYLLKIGLSDFEENLPRHQVVELSDHVSNLLRYKLLGIPSPYLQREEFLSASYQAVVSSLPIALLNQIQNFKGNPYDASSLVIRGLPVDFELGT